MTADFQPGIFIEALKGANAKLTSLDAPGAYTPAGHSVDDAGDKEERVPVNKVASLVPQQKSIMPELLLRDVTVEQAADLLEYLAGLK